MHISFYVACSIRLRGGREKPPGAVLLPEDIVVLVFLFLIPLVAYFWRGELRQGTRVAFGYVLLLSPLFFWMWMNHVASPSEVTPDQGRVSRVPLFPAYWLLMLSAALIGYLWKGRWWSRVRLREPWLVVAFLHAFYLGLWTIGATLPGSRIFSEYLIVVGLFAGALAGYVWEGEWRRSLTEHWLVVSLIIGLLHASFSWLLASIDATLLITSGALYPVLPMLMLMSYICVFIGVVSPLWQRITRLKGTHREPVEAS